MTCPNCGYNNDAAAPFHDAAGAVSCARCSFRLGSPGASPESAASPRDGEELPAVPSEQPAQPELAIDEHAAEIAPHDKVGTPAETAQAAQ